MKRSIVLLAGSTVALALISGVLMATNANAQHKHPTTTTAPSDHQTYKVVPP